VAGVDEAKDDVKEIVDFLREPDRFATIGGRIPKGILLVGLQAPARHFSRGSIAGEAKVPFLFASGSQFVEIYAGVGAKRIRSCSRTHVVIPRASSSLTNWTPSAVAAQ